MKVERIIPLNTKRHELVDTILNKTQKIINNVSSGTKFPGVVIEDVVYSLGNSFFFSQL